MIKSSILIVNFNRPDLSKQIFFKAINVNPKKIYVSVDGPRKKNIDDSIKIREVKKIFDNYKGKIKIIKKYNKENKGCKIAVSEAITWFFKYEKMGIILEDDTLPCNSFFQFCDYALIKYERDNRIMMVSGTNYFGEKISSNKYFFSQHFSIWGWATWRRAWNTYSVNLKNWPNKFLINNLYYRFSKKTALHFEYTFNALKDSFVDTWDIQWVYNCIFNNGYSVTPVSNLISNIGVFGKHSTGKTDSHFLKYGSLNIKKIQSPKYFCVNHDYDYKLHLIKNYRAIKRKQIIKLLKKAKVYNFLKKVKANF
jgi:hypothetical protein